MAEEIWSKYVDPYCVIHMMAADWTDNQEGLTN
jgi:hypothetical protein